MKRHCKRAAVLLVLALTGGCAATGDLVQTPSVDLRTVQATELGFSGQTFMLAFDVDNPNPFPLPVRTVSYGVALDGYRFASGSTAASFTVPASGKADFAISVELDLLNSAPTILYMVRDSMKRDIPYELSGEFGLDIPMARSVRFRTSGDVHIGEIARQALKIP